MNEVTKIHLGRQAFTIAVDAQRELRDYLDAIKKHVHESDVVDEIEVRMAELLAERGVSGDKVILPSDVDFLKEQLGAPKDFDEDAEAIVVEAEPAKGKRLFRDPDNAVIAGVAGGLGSYFGIDAWLIRIAFIIGVVTGGWSILVYLILWILVPEAKSPTERLQMAGKPITVSNLKEVVANADIAGAAQRASGSLVSGINALFRVLLKIVGIGTILAGLSMLFAFASLGSYTFIHKGMFGPNLFPVGGREHLLVGMGIGVATLFAVLVIVLGVAMFKRAWPIKAWATGTLLGLLLVGTVGTTVLAADAAPRVHDRYQANTHTTVRPLQPFTKVNQIGEGVEVEYEQASTYSVSMRYFDHPDLSAVKTTVSGDTLTIDSSQFDRSRKCDGFCVPDIYNVTITVHSPNPPSPDIPPASDQPLLEPSAVSV